MFRKWLLTAMACVFLAGGLIGCEQQEAPPPAPKAPAVKPETKPGTKAEAKPGTKAEAKPGTKAKAEK